MIIIEGVRGESFPPAGSGAEPRFAAARRGNRIDNETGNSETITWNVDPTRLSCPGKPGGSGRTAHDVITL
jgi:hypothetical protein